MSIRLSEPDESLTIGLRITFIAEASDDKDTPRQLRYSWKVERLDTGKTAGGSTGSRNTLSWTPRLSGSARITVTVTDRDGAEGQDSIEVNIEKPKIEKIEFKGAEKNKTSEYLAQGILAARRGQYFGIDVTPSHFNSEIHNVRLFIDDERIEKGRPNPTQWVFLKAKLGKTKLGTTKIRYYVFTPSAIPIGYYKIEVALTQDETDEEMDRKALDPELAVLFNPFSNSVLDDVSVREKKPLGNDEALFYTLNDQEVEYYPPQYPSGYDVTPSDPSIFKVALKFLEELPEADRAQAENVAAHLTKRVNSEMIWGLWQKPYCLKGSKKTNVPLEQCYPPFADDGSGYRQWHKGQCLTGGNNSREEKPDCLKNGGIWIDNPYAAGATPGSWTRMSDLCQKYLETNENVKYGQCFIFGILMTALNRSLGIPIRTVTTLGSGHDSIPLWGVHSTFYDKNGKTISFEPWNFHCWNEAWLPAVNGESGWAVLDATGQGRASNPKADNIVAVPGLNEIPRVPRLPTDMNYPGKQYPDWKDDVFVYTECNLPENYLKLDCDLKNLPAGWSNPAVVKILTQSPFIRPYSAYSVLTTSPAGPEDVVESYRPGAPAPSSFTASSILPPSFGAMLGRLGRNKAANLQVTASPSIGLSGPQRIPLRSPYAAEVEVKGLAGETPVDLMIIVNYLPPDLSGGASGPDAPKPLLKLFREMQITPRHGSWSGTVEIPAEVFSLSGHYRCAVTAGSSTAGTGTTKDIMVDGIPLVLQVPAQTAEGEVILVKAELSNTLDEAISQAELQLRLPSSWQTSDPVSVGPQELAPGVEFILEARVKASKAGKFLINAEARGSRGPSYANTEVVVVGKPDLEIDALPIEGAPVGKAFDAPVEIINDGVETANDIRVRLTSVQGIKVEGEPTQRVKALEGKSQVKLIWKIRAESKGIFRLPIKASLPGGIKAEEILVIYAGRDDPEEMEAQEDAPEEGTSKEPGGAAGTESDITIDLDEGPEPGQKASQKRDEEAAAGRTEQTPSPAAGGGGGGGQAARASTSIPLPLLGLLALLLVNTGLVVALVMRRRRPTPGAQKVAASIEVIYPDGGRKTFVIQEARTTIGRADDNSLVLHDPNVSSYHAEIVISEGSFTLRDLGSANGTFLNGERIDEAAVYQGDKIAVGSTRLIINE